jgi:hypothetical protein
MCIIIANLWQIIIKERIKIFSFTSLLSSSCGDAVMVVITLLEAVSVLVNLMGEVMGAGLAGRGGFIGTTDM